MRKFLTFLEHLFSSLTHYSRSERRGIVLLAFLATVALCAVALHPRRPLDREYLAETDRLNNSLRNAYYQQHFVPAVQQKSVAPPRPFSRPSSPTSYAPKAEVYIELNGADSATLCTVKGIGPVISRNLVRYRNRLGGFVRIEQIREVYGITDENFEAIAQQFFLDTAGIQKIDINFASANALGNHPYISHSMAERIVRARKGKGGWNNLSELIDNDIILPDEAEKVASYLLFR